MVRFSVMSFVISSWSKPAMAPKHQTPNAALFTGRRTEGGVSHCTTRSCIFPKASESVSSYWSEVGHVPRNTCLYRSCKGSWECEFLAFLGLCLGMGFPSREKVVPPTLCTWVCCSLIIFLTHLRGALYSKDINPSSVIVWPVLFHNLPFHFVHGNFCLFCF